MSELIDKLVKLNPEAMLLEPREFFDGALVDITNEPVDTWPRKAEPSAWVAVYDEFKCVQAIMRLLECDEQEALDWYCFNTIGAWMGEGTPTFRAFYDDNDDPILDS